MVCWKCRSEVPMAPFCRNCGAALPDPATRQAAIESRLGEIENERRVLESQLSRITGVAAPAPAIFFIIISLKFNFVVELPPDTTDPLCNDGNCS